ncbi:MAG TPA: glycosyltransferase family 9 protein [Gemmataceae bacterium]|nr:glycosyltransferase family 9 protein [Gemmataceae bacterium]
MNPSTLRRRQFQRILLIKPSAVGDVIHTLPVLAKLRRRYPAARIDWVLTPAIAELVGHHPALSNVVLFDRGASARDWRDWLNGLWQMLVDLWRTRYDLVIDLHGQFRSAVLTMATHAPVRIGFDRPHLGPRSPSDRRLIENAYRHGWTGTREGAWLAYTHRIPLPRSDVHAIDRYLSLVPILGLDEAPPEFHVPIPPNSESYIDTVLSRYGVRSQSFAVVVPGTIWPTKHWHIEGFAAVTRYLRGTGRAVVLAGSANERERCRAVAERAAGVLDLSGQTTLSELASLIRRAELCVTNDSGSMHLTVALGRPVVSVFGPTDEVWIGPYRRPEAVVRVQKDCAPCYFRQLSDCPHNHACMRDVTPGMVIECIERVLAGVRRISA